MQTYILRRILLMIPTLLGAVTLIFLIMRLLPGDVALYILGSDESSEMNREALQQIRSELGLDQPLIVQYGRVGLESLALRLWQFLLDATASH